jgi:hypothetical protein
MIHMFIREATSTKFSHIPNYERFKYLVENLYHYVGLEKTISTITDPFYERVLKSCMREIVIQAKEELIKKREIKKKN